MRIKRMTQAFLLALAAVSAGRLTATTCRMGETEVAVDAMAAHVVRFAAAEMTNFLSRAFGRPVPLVAAPTVGRTTILLGEFAAAEADIDVAALARDEFAMRTTEDGRIAIAGRDDPKVDPAREIRIGSPMRFERGTLFGVYAFLERFVGCRFYFPGELGECVPQRDSFDVPGDEWRVRPAFSVRRWYEGYNCTWFEGGANEPELRKANNALNILRLRMETELVPCCHGQNAFRYIERFGKTHPEYFMKLSDGTRFNHPIGGSPVSRFGQICYSSGAMEELYQDAKAYLTGQPASARGLKTWGYNCVNRRYVDIMANDAFPRCQCGRCEPRFSKTDKEQYASEMVWEETVRIANRLTAEGVGGYVTQMAYYPYRRIPAIDIPTNVLVMVAEHGPWAKTDPKELARERDEIHDWSEKLGRPVWIWTYVGKYVPQEYPGIPHYSPRAIGEFYKGVAPWIFGSFMESESDRFLYSHLNYYVFSRVAWDPKVDVDAMLDEYFRLMFGPAAAEMRAFFDGLEERWVFRLMGNVVETNLGPAAKPPSESALWREIYAKETLDGWRVSLAEAAARCAEGSLERRRVELFRDQFLKPLEEQSAAYLVRAARIEALRYPSAAEPKAMTLKPFRVKKQGFEPVKTEVSILRRGNDLVVRFVCDEPHPARTRCARLPHDHLDLWKNNGVEFFLNVSGDRQSYYHFIVTEKGDFADYYDVQAGNGRSMPQMDTAWESGAKVTTTATADGWTAEASIPLRAFKEPVRDEFPANFCRSRVLTDETFDMYSWSTEILGYHDPAAFGMIHLKKEGE